MKKVRGCTKLSGITKMIFTFEEGDGAAAQRLLRCNDAFSCLWEVDQHLRGIIKHNETFDEPTITMLEEIRRMLNEDGLLELWT